MENEKQEYTRFATSYALKAYELFYSFPVKKYMRMEGYKVPEKYHRKHYILFGQVFRYFFQLLIKDIIQNQVSFKLPPLYRMGSAMIHMVPVTGDDFIKARLNGAFDDVDYLVSDFTGYIICLLYNTRYGHWTKRIHVNKKYKDQITELTNKGVGW